MLLQLFGKWHPSKTVRTVKKKEKKKKTISFRESALEHKAISGSGSILYARCNQSSEKPLKTGAYHYGSDYQMKWTQEDLFLITCQTGFALGEFISGSALIMTGDSFPVHNHQQQQKSANTVVFFSHLRHWRHTSHFQKVSKFLSFKNKMK